MIKEKILYCEGCIEDAYSNRDIDYIRVRTAFYLDNGWPIFITIGSFRVTKDHSPKFAQYTIAGVVDCCFYAMGGEDDENNHRVPGARNTYFEYSKAEVLKYINSLGASFDKIVILGPDDGYSPYGKDNRINFSDNFSPKEENAK